ncbi:NAD(+) synthase [Collinsella sp. zg1085]|uniref:NAD(+) synthase n=1 Tax=Collinsella sp. zg1085 TaxID=2844380 RepID=UPI001C0E209F|nr:NAD(+) synthase [Collinsella sp. zg1085]QWT18185.1 NAD(+) synthase [Collinsella sp. zg1085]
MIEHIEPQDGFYRIAAATPRIRVADVLTNAEAIYTLVRKAADADVQVLVLPELCLVGYTCGDLFFDQRLLNSAEHALQELLAKTADIPVVYSVGLPVAVGAHIYNVAAMCGEGRLWGLTAKLHLPNYREFYERRWFSPAPQQALSVHVAGQDTILGHSLVYSCIDAGAEALRIGIEICEDLWVPVPPSTAMATAGDALIILNASASDEVIGKSAYRQQLVAMQSARLYAAYAYADAGFGESTTDLVFAGENLIAENGALLAKSPLLSEQMVIVDIDTERLLAERRHTTTWPQANLQVSDATSPTVVPFSFSKSAPRSVSNLNRVFPRKPFVPEAAEDLHERCMSILQLQARGLATRLAHTQTQSVVIGLSGGLDSSCALLVCVRAFDSLGLNRSGIHAVSMPGFGTSKRTRSNAQLLAEALGVDFREISIAQAVMGHFEDIKHDVALHDVTYENAQARERTQVLMDLANDLGGFVIGTGDLSELALGWATYNADHMSMYGVNASVPKTLMRHVVAAEATQVNPQVAHILHDILETPVSPELLPPTNEGDIAQKTEDLVGPYELHDYFLYYVLRFGMRPSRMYRQACVSFADAFDVATILHWLKVFYRRFFAQQFKRSCLPDGPKVGSVTLSPRGDWRMPSDASWALWQHELDELDTNYAQEKNS